MSINFVPALLLRISDKMSSRELLTQAESC